MLTCLMSSPVLYFCLGLWAIFCTEGDGERYYRRDDVRIEREGERGRKREKKRERDRERERERERERKRERERDHYGDNCLLRDDCL